MINRSALWIALALVAGCSNKQAEDGKQAAADSPADKASAKPTMKPAADLFTGNTVTLPAPIEKLTYGLPEADAKAAAPDVFAAKYGYEPPGYEGVKFKVQLEGGRVYQNRIEIRQPIDTVKAWLTAKWGEPRPEKNSIGSPEFYWDAPEVGLRAMLETHARDSMIRFYRLTSIEQALGTDPKVFGFENIPLLGATQDAVLKAFELDSAKVRDNDPGAITISLPALAGNAYGIRLELRLKDGAVTGYTMSVPNAFNDQLVPRLEAMFGGPGKLDSRKLYTDFKGPPKAKAEIRGDSGFSTTVWVGDTKK